MAGLRSRFRGTNAARVGRRQPRPRESVVVPAYNHWEEAHDHALRGLAVIPLAPGSDEPLVEWEGYQTRPPSGDEIDEWWTRWPDAGLAVVLGPVSGLVAVGVAGQPAHAELIHRLGREPYAPKILAGSRTPFHYQLLFRHPQGLETRSAITPWHPRLGFHGQGGLAVLPPSVRPSGERYVWDFVRTLHHEVEAPDLPRAVLDALTEDAADRGGRPATRTPGGLDGEQRRALAVLARSFTAADGAGVDELMSAVAYRLVHELGLTVDRAVPVFRAWNRSGCLPAWDDTRLRRTLRKADRRGGPLSAPSTVSVASAASRQGGVGAGAPAFQAVVPDWVQSRWSNVRPQVSSPRKGRSKSVFNLGPLIWAAHGPSEKFEA